MVGNPQSTLDNSASDSKNKSNDRILVLTKKEGTSAVNVKGQVDNRLFTGQNKLHCTLDPQTGLWSLKMEQGFLPGGLDKSFTSYSKAVSFVREYYNKRNVEIVKIVE